MLALRVSRLRRHATAQCNYTAIGVGAYELRSVSVVQESDAVNITAPCALQRQLHDDLPTGDCLLQ